MKSAVYQQRVAIVNLPIYCYNRPMEIINQIKEVSRKPSQARQRISSGRRDG